MHGGQPTITTFFAAFLCIAGTASAGEKMISPARADDISPAWSPDGKWIACLTRVRGTRRVCIMRANGAARAVLPVPRKDASAIAWSPDGNRLAVVFLERGKKEFLLLSVRGRGLLRMGQGRDPAFSPDGKYLAYVAYNSLRVLELAPGKVHMVAKAAAVKGIANPSWTPDSRGIVYSSDGSLWQARVQEGGFSEPSIFVKRERYPYRRVLFSPDGSKALLVGDSSVEVGQQVGDPLWLANADGRGAKRIPEGYSPGWVQGAKWPIVCARGRDIYLLGTGPGEKTKLASGRSPAVSPDGKRLAFQRRVKEGDGDDLFGQAARSKIFVWTFGNPRPLAEIVAAALAPGPEAPWTIRISASVDVGLKDRTDAIARVDIDLPSAMNKAGLDVRGNPRSLRVFEKRDGAWAEVASSVKIDPAVKGSLIASWLMPGKNEMLALREYLLCFRPAGAGHAWIRPAEWHKTVPPPRERNLVKNPSLELLDKKTASRPASWTISETADRKKATVTVETTNACHGKRCVRLDATDRMATPGLYSSLFPLKPRAKYTCSFAFRSEFTRGMAVVVWVYFYDRDRKSVGRDIGVYRRGIRKPPHSKDWRVARAVFQAPPGTAWGGIQAHLWRTVGASWVDRFSITPFERKDEVRVGLGKARLVE